MMTKTTMCLKLQCVLCKHEKWDSKGEIHNLDCSYYMQWLS